MIASALSTQNLVAMSDKRQYLFKIKYIQFFLQIIKQVFYLLNTFRTPIDLHFSSFIASNT